jgi:glycosyltransferase involved in cell wall biosynthesis
VRPKVSVIIPAYNAEAYIAETLASVFSQTYNNYEIIVVDDGSTDKTWQILRSYGDRIKALTKPNGGPASARNLAIKQARGELIAFLDSDDLWVEDKLAEQVRFLDCQTHIGMVYSEALMFTQQGDRRIIKRKIGYAEAPTFCKLLIGNFIPNLTVMLRRACVDKVGPLNEAKEMIAIEDYEYWLRVAKLFPIAGIARPLAYYRVRADNLVGDGRDIEQGLRLTLTVLREVERLFPHMWDECQLDREMIFARLHIRAGFAWKRQKNWRACLRKYAEALRYSRRPRVFRWLLAASLLQRWS